MMVHSEASLQAALDWLQPRLRETPEVALILGSGLGALAASVSAAIEVSVQEIPGYPPPTVSGHAGRLVFGRLEGCRVVVLQGRLHCYEGYSPQTVTLPVRLMHALGARSLIVTNAAGGLNPHFRPGMLMLIVDHINAAFRNPLVGQLEDRRPRMRGAPDMAHSYDPAWLATAEAVALRLGIPIRRGVYLWTLGPSYETKAEIRMYRWMGADAVGMSTVPEVLQARKLGMKVLGISTITNMAAGLHSGPLTHEEVLQVGLQVRNQLERLIRGILYQQSAKKF